MDLEVDTDLIRGLAQRIGDVADILAAAVPAERSETTRGLTTGSAAVREAQRAISVAEAHSCAAACAVVSRMTEISDGMQVAARAFDLAESFLPEG